MNTLTNITEPLGWALLHFLWQGAAIAVLLRGFLWLARRSAPQVRYVAAGAALLLMLGAAVGTVWWQWRGDGAAATNDSHGTHAEAVSPAAGVPLEAHASLAAVPVVLPAVPDSALPSAPVAALPPFTAAERLRALLPWLVGVWAAGVALFSLRLMNGWRTVRRWRASGTEAVPAEWRARFAALCERLRVTRVVRLLSSATLAVPVVIGWLKPVVLVPAGLFSGLSAAQLEAILAHELAHIRRQDYLVNLLQTVVETVLFYHPAVWWVSAQLRQEREHCCDDIAASLHGDALGYARALTVLEELRAAPALSLSATGGSLLSRIRRLAGLPEERAARAAWPLGILALAALAFALPFTVLRTDGAPAVPKVPEEPANRGSGFQPEVPQPQTPGGTPEPRQESAVPPLPDGKQTIEHNDGTRTEVEKDEGKGQTTETTFSKSGERICRRVFLTDKMGRPRTGLIYDAQLNIIASILYGYDKATDEPTEEQQYNKEGKLTRRLFYPGALKDPKYAGRYVAFTYDPDDPKAEPKGEAGEAKPTRPLEEPAAAEKAGGVGEVRRLLDLGTGFYDLGQFAKAKESFAQASKLDPANAAVRRMVKMAEEKEKQVSGDPPPDAVREIVKPTADMLKFATELDISVPAADAGNVKDAGRVGELVINVKEDGSVDWKGKSLTLEQLSAELAEVAKHNKKQAIIIRGDVATPYAKIVAVLDLTHKAGLFHVSFATTKAVEPEAVAQARALFQKGRVEAAAARVEAEAAKKWKRGDAATEHYVEGISLLIAHDKADKKSVPGRTLMAQGYAELGRLMARTDQPRDASVAFAEAVKVYVELLKELPANPALKKELAAVYLDVVALSHAKPLAEKGNDSTAELLPHAARLLREVLELTPDDAGAKLMLQTAEKALFEALADSGAGEPETPVPKAKAVEEVNPGGTPEPRAK